MSHHHIMPPVVYTPPPPKKIESKKKRVGIGYTLNFGNPVSWAVLAGVLVVPLVMTGLLLHELMG